MKLARVGPIICLFALRSIDPLPIFCHRWATPTPYLHPISQQAAFPKLPCPLAFGWVWPVVSHWHKIGGWRTGGARIPPALAVWRRKTLSLLSRFFPLS